MKFNTNKTVIKFSLCDILLLFYMCILLGNRQKDEGNDVFILRLSFSLLVAYFTFFELFLKKKIKYFIREPLVIWGMVFSAYSLLTSLWAQNTEVALSLSNQFLQCFVLLSVVVVSYREKNDVHKLLKIVLIASVYCMVMVFIRTPKEFIGIKRLGKFSGINVNTFGCMMAIAFIISYFYMFKSKRKVLCFVLCILFAYFALNSGSKKALFAMIIGVISVALLTPSSLKKYVIFIFSIVVTLVFYYLIINNTSLYELIGVRVETMIETVMSKGEFTKGSTAERLSLIKEAKEYFFEKPLFGIGLNNFSVVSEYKKYAHNNYWEILSTIGMTGFLIVYGLYFSIIKNGFKFFVKTKDEMLVLLLTYMIVRIMIDYAMVTFYKPYFMFLTVIFYNYINIAYVREAKHYNNNKPVTIGRGNAKLHKFSQVRFKKKIAKRGL